MGMFLVCLLFGYLGIHKFIEKKTGLGVLYLLTCGLFGIGWIVDCIIYLTKWLKSRPKKTDSSYPAAREANQTLDKSDSIETPKAIETTEPNPEPIEEQYETHRVAGVSFRQKQILTLAEENPEYDVSKKELLDPFSYKLHGRRIYQYTFNPMNVELVPEPENPQDPNAIKVIVDNVHVGYIKREANSHINQLISEDRIDYIKAFIGGGKYKCVDYDPFKDKDVYEADETTIFVELKIYTKEE